MFTALLASGLAGKVGEEEKQFVDPSMQFGKAERVQPEGIKVQVL